MRLLDNARFIRAILVAFYIILNFALVNAQYSISDTLTYILRPLVNIPVIAPVNQSFYIEVEADETQTDWQVELLFDGLSYDLPIDNAYFLEGGNRWLIYVTAPSDIPLVLYDLRLMSQSLEDTVVHTVKLIDDYRSEFYFIHITDTHLPTTIYHDETGGLTDTSAMADLWSLVEDFEILNPEFVLFTGDIVNEGELEDYMELHSYSRSKHILSNFSVPVYLGAGNHDLGGWDDTPPEDGTARRDWWRFFGWKYLDQTSGPGPYTQDYYFDYGDIRFIELEAYDNYDGWRSWIYGTESFTMLQKLWLSDVLDATPSYMDIATFIHYDFNESLDIEGLGIDLNLYGHIHYDLGSINTQPYDLATDNVCDGSRAFRVVYYDEEGFHPQLTFHAGSYGQSLTVDYSPANDGTNDSVTATVYNGYDYTFNHARVIFDMPAADTFYVNYGEIRQIVKLDSLTRCFVEYSLPANSTTEITIEADDFPFIPGDANGNGKVLSGDVTYLVYYFRDVFPMPEQYYAGDANGDCELSVSDITYLVNYIHGLGPTPVDGNCD